MARRTSCPAYRFPDGRYGNHKWEQKCTRCNLVHDGEALKPCRVPWQWQLVCACGQLASDEVYGHRDPNEEGESTENRVIDLDQPADLAAVVEALFDNNLDWPTAVRSLQPHYMEKRSYEIAAEWSEDPRVQAAVDSYVKRLSNDTLQRTWLQHLTQKLSTDSSQTGAVRATALNIQKAILVTEKSEEHRTGVFRVEGLEKGMRKMLGDEHMDNVEPSKELLN